jgi:hypothetical protein
MNIFEILASGNNGLNEVHVSAVLGWLLDPNHDHGLGMEVLKRIGSELFKDSPLDKGIQGSAYSGIDMSERYGRRRIDTYVEVEKEVLCPETQNNRNIDVVVKIKDEFILAFENKTRSASKEHGQVSDEIAGLREKEPDISNKDGLYFVYLVKKDTELDYADEELKKAPKANKRALPWISDKGLSMSKILQEIVLDHNQGKINPIPTETLFLLRSFIRFAENGFTYYLPQNDDSKRYSFIDLKTFDLSCFVGFQGGIKALEKSLLDQNSLYYLMTDRPYRISRNKRNDNWIELDDFLECFKKSSIPI